MISRLIIGEAIVLGIVQALYFFLFFRKIFGLSSNADGIAHWAEAPQWAVKPFSVIICAHNEAIHLAAFLPRVLKQNFYFKNGQQAFEVIVVDDCSTDGSDALLAHLSTIHPHLRVISIDAHEGRAYPGKKYPLSKGLAAARYEWIACTDADCTPATDIWLHCLAAPLQKGKMLALGYGGYVLQRGLLNTFTRYETMHTFMLYYCFSKSGIPYMGVGRNMAATKTAFLSAQSHPLWSKTPSGDDDLLVQICSTSRNVGMVTHPASFTWTASKEKWTDYFVQKQRHVSTGKLYSFKTKLALAGYVVPLFLSGPMVLAVVIFHQSPLLAILSAAGWILFPITFVEGTPFIKQRTNVLGWMAFLFCWLLYNIILSPFILWKTKQRWK